MDSYLIPHGYGEDEFVERHSRFIGRVWFTETEEEALLHIKEMRSKHWDANHNVYAYAIRNGGIMRYSDDGEPQGTSGMPVLNVFRMNGITNFCCVVTRYFGGILLGAGGLVRAYSHTAKIALDAAGISEVRLWKTIVMSCTYGQYEKLRGESEAAGAIVTDVDYGVDVMLTLLLPEEAAEGFIARIVDITAGTVLPEIMGEEFRAVRMK